MWGGEPGKVNGNLVGRGARSCYGNTGTTWFYGFGNCDTADRVQGSRVYYGPGGSKLCPGLKVQLFA